MAIVPEKTEMSGFKTVSGCIIIAVSAVAQLFVGPELTGPGILLGVALGGAGVAGKFVKLGNILSKMSK